MMDQEDMAEAASAAIDTNQINTDHHRQQKQELDPADKAKDFLL